SKLNLKHHASLFYESAKDCMPEQLKNMLFVFGYGLKPPDFSASLTALWLRRRTTVPNLLINFIIKKIFHSKTTLNKKL
ncbi:MAG: hypothetical protein KJ799_06205, partial [Bacteroidetes bacterium]|nr:hypothetical protein [Bacteroidota bacterium]